MTSQDLAPPGSDGAASPGGPTHPSGAAEPTPVSVSALASGTRWVFLARILTQALRFAVSVLLARWLSPEAFGIVAVALTTVAAMEIVKDMGTGAAVIQRPEVDQTLLSTVFVVNVVAGVLGAGLMVVGATLIAGLFGAPGAAPAVRALSLILVMGGLTLTHHAMLRRTMKFARVAAVEVTGAVTMASVSIVLAILGYGVWSLVWGNVAGAAIGGVVAWVVSGWRPSARFSWPALRSIARFSLGTMAYNVCTFALQNVDKVLVGRLLGTAPLGVYSLGQRTVSYPVASISQTLMTVLFPALARVQNDPAALRRGYTLAVGAIAFITLPIMLGVAAVATPLVAVLLGPQWTELVPLLWFMAPAGALQAVLSAVNSIYSAKGKADWMFYWGAASGVVQIIAYVIGLQWGLIGLAIAYLGSQLVLLPVGMALSLRLIDMRLGTFMAGMVPYGVLSIVMAGSAFGAWQGAQALGWNQLAQLVAGVVVGAVVYLGGTALWRPPAASHVLRAVRMRRA